ncbi:MAG TPA: putative toxin-antitoxin system toxin component, PIN family [Tepidisphaeraceae bacterium]|jgi:putative PIN family toxin of toxin-antitoxin system
MTLPTSRPRVVFDCNVLVQAVAFDNGPAARCLRLVESGQIDLLVSRPTLAELRRVLNYEEVLAISPNMTPRRIGAFLKRLTFRARLVCRTPHVMDYPRDPADEPYIDLAVAAGADYLVTRDRDLLSLMSGYSLVCKEFRRKTRPLRVIDPVAFLKIMAG